MGEGGMEEGRVGGNDVWVIMLLLFIISVGNAFMSESPFTKSH